MILYPSPKKDMELEMKVETVSHLVGKYFSVKCEMKCLFSLFDVRSCFSRKIWN